MAESCSGPSKSLFAAQVNLGYLSAAAGNSSRPGLISGKLVNSPRTTQVKQENHIDASLSTRSIEDHLQRILASKEFASSARMSRFLRFAVERALSGQSEQLKEYVLGVEVFDRKESYDPRVDPIVRVEARRLRSKLESYYAGAAPT